MSDSSEDFDAVDVATSATGERHRSSLSLRFQKKIASKLSNKTIAKTIIDERTGRVMENIQELIRLYSEDKKFAHKFLNKVIKIVVKIEILIKNKQFNAKEKENHALLVKQFHLYVNTAMSMHNKTGPLDPNHLHNQLVDCQKTIQAIVARHLTDKSKKTIDFCFDYLSNERFFQQIYTQSKYEKTKNSIASDIKFMLENNQI